MKGFKRIQDYNLYKRSLDLDFPERVTDDKPEASQEDNKFMEKVLNSLSTQDCLYVMCLPFRNDYVSLPNNCQYALQRLRNLQRKLAKNERFHDDYKMFMRSLLNKGYANNQSIFRMR